jgi:LmbE family N-acetylglucosaminyl deacetylase
MVVAQASSRLSAWTVCLARSLLRRWADHMAAVQPGSPYFDGLGLGTPDEQITTLVDSTAHLPARLAAIPEHRSQTSPFAALPDGLSHDFLAVDRLRRVLPPGGPVEHELLPDLRRVNGGEGGAPP